MSTQYDALPVAVYGDVGHQVSLLDLLKNAYGDQAMSIGDVQIAYRGDDYFTHFSDGTAKNANEIFSYWDPNNPHVSSVALNGADIGVSTASSFNVRNISVADFANTMITVGNNIMPNIYIEVRWQNAAGATTAQQELNVTTVPSSVDSAELAATRASHAGAPTALDIVAAAEHVASVEGGIANANDCHFIASQIAALAGATFDPTTQTSVDSGRKDANGHIIWEQTPAHNEESGFWRIAYRGSDANPAADWQTEVQAGDIVRMGWTNGGFHTTTVVAGLNADGLHPGKIQVVDNADTGGTINVHWVDYGASTIANQTTIYRLASDHMYLIDGRNEPASITMTGTVNNDLIEAGNGGDTLKGGDGNDHLIGGNGKDVLFGDKGDDILDGGAGPDEMHGGKGNDIYYVNDAGDVVEERGFLGFVNMKAKFGDLGGVDEVRTTLTKYTLADPHDNHGLIENLTYVGRGDFTGTGNSLDNVIKGGRGHDVLDGGEGNDTLDGGAGADAMHGGAGNDTYYVDNVNDIVTEAGFTSKVFGNDSWGDMGGIDEVRTTLAQYTLADPNALSIVDYRGNIENLTYVGSGSFTGVGNALDNVITGGAHNDKLTGGAGNDTIDGGGGVDVAVYSGLQSDYKITSDGTVTTIVDLRAGSPDGTDTVKNVEFFRFSDGLVRVNSTQVGAVSISDASVKEGDNGTTIETFTVTRSGGSAAFDVNFATSNGSASAADGDYVAKTGSLHFDAGVNTQTISVVVNGDTKVEANETFNVDLSGATNGATVTDAQGVGTIVNDDVAPPPPPVAGVVSISDATVTEGDNGTRLETFTVTRTGGSAAFDVHFATQAGTASAAAGDYVGKSGNLHFAEGVNTQTVSIVVNGDTKVEANETFKVNLSAATNGASIADGQGVGTIVNDDVAPVAGAISIGDATVTEGDNGTRIETFTVTRTGGSAAFDVHFATQAGSASAADGDYVGKSGNLHFDAGVNTQTISIVVNGDTKIEPTETFKVNLSAATNGATIADGQGIGTIVNDDNAPAAHHAATDFNGDGISDVLFGKTNGQLALWELDGNHVAANVTVPAVPAGWHIDGIGDFGNDGKSDVLLHSDNGKVAMWQMDGNHIASNTTVGSIGADWHVLDVADFNGDGKADVLWENTKGQVAMWEMDGDKIASNTTVGSIGSDWHLVATGDFNGDHKADIVWENAKGAVAMWQMDGDHIAANTTVSSIGSSWHSAGVGDFNGDGKADLLWQNDKGQVAMWQMDGDHVAANTTVGSAQGWNVIGTGDYNHDGKADVLWENAKGQVAEWQMDGDHIAQNLTVGSHSVDWHAV